ncbi:MAG: hypothetical protein ABI761_18835 [Saprospiraceae bacterium]
MAGITYNRFIAVLFSLMPLSLSAQMVKITYDSLSIQQSYAVSVLKKALLKQGYKLSDNGEIKIALQIKKSPSTEERFAIQVEKQLKLIQLAGSDDRDLIYASQSIADDLRRGITLLNIEPRSEQAFLPFRGIKYDLPWDTYRHSYALSQHDQICRDTAYWASFLDMMVENRFNSLTLWNLHPYTYLIKPKNFPEASPWSADEMTAWQKLFHSIMRMAKVRAIDTYIIPFNIFVTKEFALAHQVALDNLEHNFFVKGDTSEIIVRYTRECITQLLDEYPDLTGLGLTLGEGMGGMTPDQREAWVRKTFIDGMRLAHRPSKFIHRIPLSSNTGSGGATSIETEQLTRNIIESEADLAFIQSPIWADLKFNWSHAHSTPKLFKVHGGKLYDTYFKPTPSKYKIIWTARNEDFFCLRWGVPSFIKEHVLLNKKGYSGGYLVGSETYIPAKDYFTMDSVNLPWHYAFERQWLFYKLWGRTMYNPTIKEEIFQNEFIHRYGQQGKNLLTASSLAGKTPLRLASDFDIRWDFTLYAEGMMALDDKTKRVGYISVDRLIHQAPLDTDYVSIENYVNMMLAGKKPDTSKITPPLLAKMLETDCHKALELVKYIDTKKNKALMYEVADIRTWAYLGLHFAEKIKGGQALQTYRMNGNAQQKTNAVQYLKQGLIYWDEVIKITKPIYKDMPLVHYSEQDSKPWQENDHLRFHWKYLRDDVAKDVEIASQAKYH